jgi:hypothetical protein
VVFWEILSPDLNALVCVLSSSFERRSSLEEFPVGMQGDHIPQNRKYRAKPLAQRLQRGLKLPLLFESGSVIC